MADTMTLVSAGLGIAMLAICMHQHHIVAMSTSITVRNVPNAARDELAARAASTGRSLQEYIRAQLIELAHHPDPEVLLARVRERKQRTATRLTAKSILAHRDAGRR